MKKIINLISIIITLTIFKCNAQNMNFSWAKQAGGNGLVFCYSIATDASGNVYTTGMFTHTIDFDPGPGIYNLTTGNTDIYVCKMNTSGNLVWAKQMGSNNGGGGVGNAICVDASGNVYTTGYFSGTVDFDPGSGISNLTSTSNDIFVSKLDASGNFTWAKQMGSAYYDDIAYSIGVDASGSVYTSGYFRDVADFDPGAGIYNLTSAGLQDIFISKLDASGNFVWAKRIGAAFRDVASSLTVDAAGNSVVTGYYQGTADFDPGAATYNVTSNGDADIFVIKLDATGNMTWVKSLGGTLSDMGSSIAMDITGNIYLRGAFTGAVDFDPGAGTFFMSPAFNPSSFILKLNSLGNFVWVKQISGIGEYFGKTLACDFAGNVLLTSFFFNTVDFDPGTSVYNLTSPNNDLFISKLDSSGNFVWAKQITGTVNNNMSYGIAPDPAGNIYVSGHFENQADFDPGAGVCILNHIGSYDMFVMKLIPASTLPITLQKFEGISLGNGNQLTWSTASEENNDYFELERSYDGKYFSAIAKIDGAGNSSSILSYDYLDREADGNKTAYYHLRQVDFNGKYSYSKIISLKVNNKSSGVSLSIFPNPVTEKSTIAFNLFQDEHVNISICDLKGNLIYTLVNKKFTSGIHSENWNISDGVNQKLNNGIYTLKLTINNLFESKKFNIIH